MITNHIFLITLSFQPGGVNLLYLKITLFDQHCTATSENALFSINALTFFLKGYLIFLP